MYTQKCKWAASQRVVWDHVRMMVSEKWQPSNHREVWKHVGYDIKNVGLWVYHRQECPALTPFWRRQEQESGPISQSQGSLWKSSVRCSTKWQPLGAEIGEGNRQGVWKMYKTLGQVGHMVGSRGRASPTIRMMAPVPAHAESGLFSCCFCPLPSFL